MKKSYLLAAVSAVGLVAACGDRAPTPVVYGGPSITVDCEPVMDSSTGAVMGYEVVTRNADTGADIDRRPLGQDEECP